MIYSEKINLRFKFWIENRNSIFRGSRVGMRGRSESGGGGYE